MRWKNESGLTRTSKKGIVKIPELTVTNIGYKFNTLEISNNLNLESDISSNTLFCAGDIDAGNLYVANDISTNNNLYIVNDISTNNLYVENDISINNNLYVENSISANNNLYVANDISVNNNLYVDNNASTNNLHIVNDISTNNNMYVINDICTNNLYVYDTDPSFDLTKININDLSINDLVINNDISFNSDKISISSQENGTTNSRKLEILNSGGFSILNEDNNKIYDFTSGFIIKHVINSLTIDSNTATKNQYNLYTQIDISKNVGSDIGVVFLSQNNVNTGAGEDSYAAKIEITPQSGSAINDEYKVVYYADGDPGQSNAARGLCGLNCLNFTSDNANVRSSSHLTLKVYFKFLNDIGGTQTDDALTITNGRWIIACDPIDNLV